MIVPLTQVNSGGFGLSQGETRHADLDQQWITAPRGTRHDAHRLAWHKAEITQTTGNMVVPLFVLDTLDDRMSPRRQFSQ
jgi:hypothetical protein